MLSGSLNTGSSAQSSSSGDGGGNVGAIVGPIVAVVVIGAVSFAVWKKHRANQIETQEMV